MGRPRKNPEDRKDYHLRVPLAQEQHALIGLAAVLSEKDKADWARTILLDAAKKVVSKCAKDRLDQLERDKIRPLSK